VRFGVTTVNDYEKCFYMGFTALLSGRYKAAFRRNKPQGMIFVFYRENGGNILLRNGGYYLTGEYCATSRKAIPLQAWTDPAGSKRLRRSDFVTFGRRKW
jgi:hypothetical protein